MSERTSPSRQMPLLPSNFAACLSHNERVSDNISRRPWEAESKSLHVHAGRLSPNCGRDDESCSCPIWVEMRHMAKHVSNGNFGDAVEVTDIPSNMNSLKK